MRYIARLHPAPNPLQAVCHGVSLEPLRSWAKAILSAAVDGARVDIYERVEVLQESFVKEGKDVISKTPILSAALGGGTSTAVAESRDEVAPGIERKG